MFPICYTMLIYYITFVVLSLVLAEGQQTTQDDPFSFGGHCRCKFNQDKRRRTGSNAQAMLNDTARASEC
uniref:FXYD domain containing ion transport regulator 1 (phospholemman) n=1 Tax=Cyprinus carpio TaxID=7962 RepID=A0A8C2ECC0_CYPCA